MTCACEMHKLEATRHGIVDNDAMQTHTDRVCAHFEGRDGVCLIFSSRDRYGVLRMRYATSVPEYLMARVDADKWQTIS